MSGTGSARVLRDRCGFILVELVVATVLIAVLAGITIWYMDRRAMVQRPVLLELRGLLRWSRPGDCFRVVDDVLYERPAGSRRWRKRLRLHGVRVTGGDGTEHRFCFAYGRMALVSRDQVLTGSVCFAGEQVSSGPPVCLSPLAVVYEPQGLERRRLMP